MGNDIVDLCEPGNVGKHQDARFVDRVFTRGEQALIKSSPEPDRVLWSLWAAKESVYKIEARLNPESIFAHRRFELGVVNPGLDSGEMVYQGRFYQINWVQQPGYIHAWAHRAGTNPRLYQLVAVIAEPVSETVRERAVGLLSSLGFDKATIVGRPPVVLLDGQVTDFGISLSHDGAYGAVLLSVRTGRRAVSKWHVPVRFAALPARD